MNKIQKELESVVDSYYDELMAVDVSVLKDYTPSKEYLTKKEEILKSFDRPEYKSSFHMRKKIIFGLIVAAIIGTGTVFAIEPSRSFILNIFSDHTEITTSENNLEPDNHKIRIEQKYSITVPEGYSLDTIGSIETDELLHYVYFNADKSKSIVFDQNTISHYKNDIDNEKSTLTTKVDKNGNGIIVHNYNDISVSIFWDNGEYCFTLTGEMAETELMKIYYSVK